MKTITFYSYKGGVGRSLALVNIASRLVEFGKKVCVLDFDLEAPGLHLKFQVPETSEESKGIVDYLYDFSTLGIVGESLVGYSVNVQLSKKNESLVLIPAGNPNSSEYWRKLSSINWFDMIYENPNGLAFFLNLKETIKNDFNPDFLLIDSRTGISEMSGISLSLLADEIVIISANNRENLEGARRIIKSLNSEENKLFDESPNLHFVLSRIPFTNKPEDKIKEVQLLSKIKREYLGPYISDINIIHSDRELEEVEKIKIASFIDESVSQISMDYLKLFEKITSPYLSESELAKFNNLRLAEKYLAQANNSDQLTTKLEYASKAVELFPENPEFYIFRASIYYQYEMWEETYNEAGVVLKYAENNIDALLYQIISLLFRNKELEAEEKIIKVLSLNPTNYVALNCLITVYTLTTRLEEAIRACNHFISLYPEDSTTYSSRGNVYRELKQFDKAFEDVYKALEIDSNNVHAITTLAEIYAELGKMNEFYFNLESALKSNSKFVRRAIRTESVYEPLKNEERFIALLEKYDVSI